MTIEHIFVLMLENRSFDHMFAFSNVPGIKVATAADTNTFGSQTYACQPGAPDRKPSDPSHGFAAVLQQQLCGEGSDPNKVSPPPPAPMAAASVSALADPLEPIEQATDLPGFLYVARKSQRKRQGDLQAMTAFQPVRTRADAQAYLDAAMPQLEAARTKKAGGA